MHYVMQPPAAAVDEALFVLDEEDHQDEDKVMRLAWSFAERDER